VTDGTPPVTAESRVSDGCDACDGFAQNIYRYLPTIDPSGSLLPGEGLPLSEVFNNPSNPSHPSLVRGSGVTASVPPVTEALPEDPLVLGDWVWLLLEDGAQQNVSPYQIRAIARGSDERCYARFAETPIGWPLAQCTRADPPSPGRPPPCAVCGGTARWDHKGVLRCVTCWPLEGSRQTPGQTGLCLPQGSPEETDDEQSLASLRRKGMLPQLRNDLSICCLGRLCCSASNFADSAY